MADYYKASWRHIFTSRGKLVEPIQRLACFLRVGGNWKTSEETRTNMGYVKINTDSNLSSGSNWGHWNVEVAGRPVIPPCCPVSDEIKPILQSTVRLYKGSFFFLTFFGFNGTLLLSYHFYG